MPLKISFEAKGFPSSFGMGSGTLDTSWDELLWAALTIGRPNTAHVFRHGEASVHEALFRLSLIRMAVEQRWSGRLRRTTAFTSLDPTEKGAVSYFLGMTLCKLFASRLLNTPWLLHLDVFRGSLRPTQLGRSRPDLVGLAASNRWHAFECKGRSGPPSAEDISKAKGQAQRLTSVNGQRCQLHVGTFAYFKAETLRFYWCDPTPEDLPPLQLPSPNPGWQYYYESALSLVADTETSTFPVTRDSIQVTVKIHPEIAGLLSRGLWTEAHETATQLRELLLEEGFQADGLKVSVGQAWQQPFDAIRRE